MMTNLTRMKCPYHALLNQTQIQQESASKKSIAVLPEPLAIVVGAARIVTERFD